MCGIAGFIDFNKKLTRDNLISMTDALEHRGPDGSGYETWTLQNAHVGFGHRRLSILDLSPLGQQPMTKHGRYLIFNGEVYNFKSIRQELEENGYQFKSNSDSEVILSAFDLWGNKMVDKLNGMFIIILFDHEKEKVIFFRDRAGVKPIYFYKQNNIILFASELKSFHKIEQADLKINREAVTSFFYNGLVKNDLCIFENCFKMSPGTYLEIDINSKDIKSSTYWNVTDFVDDSSKKDLSEEALLKELDTLLKSSCNYRMVSDVPVGVFLSGGYDSSLVSALLQTTQTQKIKTFNIGFEFDDFDESKYAKMVADHLGTEHYSLKCTEMETKAIIPKLPFLFDEPFGDSSAIPTYLVSKFAREHVTVALSADGGDEQFIGYNRYPKALKLAKFKNKLPQFASSLVGTIKSFSNKPIDQKVAQILKNNSTYSIPLIQTKFLSDQEAKSLFTYESKNKEIQNRKKSNNLNMIFAAEYQNYMQDDIMVKVDRAAMGVSLEGREPLLDYRIAEYVMQLPAEVKYKNGVLKYLLKKITHKYIPASIMDRPKQGFGVPINHWLRNDLKELLDHYLDPTLLKQYGDYLNSNYVAQRKQAFLDAKDNSSFIWNVLIFQMWYEKWMT